MDFAALAELCAPEVPIDTLGRIVSVESNLNPYAIGVVGGRLERQPQTLSEAVATAQMLATKGYDFSVGLMQVNQRNFARFGLSITAAFDECHNLRIGARIYRDCLTRAGRLADAEGKALSCYYSGNFATGYKAGYVTRVLNAAIAFRPNVEAVPLPGSALKVALRGNAAPPNTPRAQILSVSSNADHGVVAGDLSGTPKIPSTALLF